MTNLPWYEWWWANQWRFIRIPQRLHVATGTGKEKGQSLAEVVKFLTSGLKEPYFDIKGSAALALGKTGDKESASKIRLLLKSKHDEVKESAMLALGMLKDEKSIPQFQRFLEDRRYPQSVRVPAALGLGLIGGDKAGPPLMKALETEHGDKTGMTVEIRAACCLALGALKYRPALGPLIRILESNDADPRLRAMAATALGKFESSTIMLEDGGEVSPVEHLLTALQTTKPPAVRRSAILALGNVWYEGLGSSIVDLHHNDPDPWVKNLSLLLVAEKEKRPDVLKALKRRLREILGGAKKDRNMVNFAAVAAGLSGDEEAIPLLRSLFGKDRKESTRAAAAVGLGFLKDEDSTPRFLEVLCGSGSQFLKSFCCVAFALMEKGDERVSKVIRGLVTDPKNTNRLRATASIVLAKIGDFGAVHLLCGLLEKGDRDFRKLMVISVGYFRDLGAFPPLKKLFKSKKADFETKAFIMVALGYIVERDHPSLLRNLFENYNYLLTYPNLTRLSEIM
ncbi:MAG: HEAT repeat domain-containing protein [Planctomycetota bacterium]